MNLEFTNDIARSLSKQYCPICRKTGFFVKKLRSINPVEMKGHHFIEIHADVECQNCKCLVPCIIAINGEVVI